MMQDMLKEEWNSMCHTLWAGHPVYYYDVVDSTNRMAVTLAQEGAAHGTLVVADRQEAGRGRRGRSWESPANSGIFMSLILRPEIAIENAPMLTLVTALAVTKAFRRMTGLDVSVKWPNDIVIHGKKICGILTEMGLCETGMAHVVVGIGINVHNEAFPKELQECATSVYLESGMHISRTRLLVAVLEEFEAYYAGFMNTQDLSELMEEYNAYLVNRDKQVRVLEPENAYDGIARGITKRGELIVETGKTVQYISSGEVSVRGIYGYV